ncbi:16362_t:CDS:2 [Cetraspora pellucida]|uniref:16362_t:CDS:1 n=1 Tax=Cetraspora pellucida TaxID=1433469 RepID=A0A9N8WNW4_9GLOM|nr:16362_t:CDS:2 [Cetraspora pellucida]
MTEGKKLKTKTVCVYNSNLFTEFSKDVLNLYKRTSSEIEKIRASNHAFTKEIGRYLDREDS